MISLSYSIIFDLYSSDGWMISFTLNPRNMKRYADLYSTPQETLFGPSPVDVRAVFDRDRPFAARLRITRYFYSRFRRKTVIQEPVDFARSTPSFDPHANSVELLASHCQNRHSHQRGVVCLE